MIPDGTYTATVDRLEGEDAVLLVEEDGEDIDQLVVEQSALPWRAREPNTVLHVTVVDGAYKKGAYQPDETERRTESAASRFDRLSRRPPSDDDS